MNKKLGEKILKAIANVFPRVEVAVPKTQPPTSADRAEAFENEEEELDRLYGKDGYRPQTDGFTVDDLMDRVTKIRETGSPIAD